MSHVRIPPNHLARVPVRGTDPAPRATPAVKATGASPVATPMPAPSTGAMASVQGTAYAFNPLGPDPGDDASLQKALEEAGAGITFTDADFAGGVNFATKSVDGLTATAIYDPRTHGITAWGSDTRGDVMIEQAAGLAGTYVHFGLTTEAQLKGEAVAIGNMATTHGLGFAPDGAVAQSDVQASVVGDSSPTASDAVSITLVGDRDAHAQAVGRAMATAPASPGVSSPTV